MVEGVKVGVLLEGEVKIFSRLSQWEASLTMR